jgi:hypothetical protein
LTAYRRREIFGKRSRTLGIFVRFLPVRILSWQWSRTLRRPYRECRHAAKKIIEMSQLPIKKTGPRGPVLFLFPVFDNSVFLLLPDSSLSPLLHRDFLMCFLVRRHLRISTFCTISKISKIINHLSFFFNDSKLPRKNNRHICRPGSESNTHHANELPVARHRFTPREDSAKKHELISQMHVLN